MNIRVANDCERAFARFGLGAYTGHVFDSQSLTAYRDWEFVYASGVEAGLDP